MKDLTRIFHTDRDEEAAKADGARRAMKSDNGCACTHCPRKTSRSTQYPSGFPASVVDWYEISGLTRIFHTDRDEKAAKADGARRAMKSDNGCERTYCPRSNSKLTQYPSGFPTFAGDRHEIYGLRSFILTNTLGTCLEYLDATLYAFFSTIIAGIFFPEENPKLALLLTFAVFAISFIVRPLGALLFGYFGDRFGRRNILAINILMMAVGTITISLIPGYRTWGATAPLLLILCRIIQGLAISSEYTGSSIYLLETVQKSQGLFSGISTAARSFGIFLPLY